MDESPLVSQMIKEYINKHKLEEKFNEAVNEVLRNMPDDPFSLLCVILKNSSSSTFILNNLYLFKTMNNDFKPVIWMELIFTFKGNTRRCISSTLTYNAKLYETIQTSMENVIAIYEKNFMQRIEGFTIEQFSSFDKMLKSISEDLSTFDQNTGAIGRMLSNAISVSAYASQSIIQEINLRNYVFNEFKSEFEINSEIIPKLAFCIFKCGKSMNSKVKYERFFLIINNSSKMKKEDIQALVCKIYASVRKVLTSGKQGENGMRLNPEGCYYPPNDTLNDVVKLMEEIVKDTGESAKLSIGIDCNANNYFNETTKKYDMEGLKKPPEADELIDYYLKYMNDHPLINYLEDPICDSDVAGWKKIYTKFDLKPNLTVSCKNLVGEDSERLTKMTMVEELEEVGEFLSEEEKTKINADNKIKAEENAKKLYFNNISFRLNECVTLSELFDSFKYIKSKMINLNMKHPGVTIWDSPVENDQTHVIDIALGLRANMIVLHGINNKNERVNKINRYIDLIEELY